MLSLCCSKANRQVRHAQIDLSLAMYESRNVQLILAPVNQTSRQLRQGTKHENVRIFPVALLTSIRKSRASCSFCSKFKQTIRQVRYVNIENILAIYENLTRAPHPVNFGSSE